MFLAICPGQKRISIEDDYKLLMNYMSLSYYLGAGK